MGKKLKTRKEYSRDEVQYDALDPLRDFEGGPVEYWLARASRYIQHHIKEVLIGVAAIFLLGGGIIGYSIWQKRQQEASLKAYEKMMDNPIMIPGAGSTEAAVRKLDEYAQKYSGRGAENRAALKKIEFFVKDRNFSSAGEASGQIAKDVSDPYLKSYFLIRAGSYMEMAGKYQDSAAFYEDAVKNVNDANLLKVVGLYGQARSLIAQNKIAEGKSVLKSMMELKDVPGIDDFRLSASAYLLRHAVENEDGVEN